ncbi:MAG TPA: hypothetical protein VI819_00750 [Patescibacteria group bacterium]|nr:hypothetical protein [Patescibacteria group bacterium]
MLELPHAIVGAALVYKIGNPWISLPAAFLSHFILDEIPHWNPHLGDKTKKLSRPFTRDLKIIIIDSTAALIFGTSIAMMKLPDIESFTFVMLGAFFAVLPDLIEAPFFFLNFDQYWIKSWLGFQRKHQNNTNIYWGVLTQFLVVVAAVIWIFS